MKRIVFNVIVGSLNPEINECKSFLLNTVFIPNTKSATIVQSFNNSMEMLFPGEMKYKKLLVILTDGAHNISAGKILCSFYEKLMHVTCLHTHLIMFVE
jgi:hypothetical protein